MCFANLIKKSLYFITDISGQVCPLMLQNYFFSHSKRTNFRQMIGYANVNFLLIFLAPEKAKQSFDDSPHFTTDIFLKKYGVSNVNFLWIFFVILYLSHFTTDKFLKNFNPRPKKFPSHITTYIFSSKSRYPIKKIFCFHTKRTIFRQMVTS